MRGTEGERKSERGKEKKRENIFDNRRYKNNICKVNSKQFIHPISS